METEQKFYHVDVVQLEIGGIEMETDFDLTNIVNSILFITIGHKDTLVNSITVWNDCTVEIGKTGNISWIPNLNDGGKKTLLNKHI